VTSSPSDQPSRQGTPRRFDTAAHRQRELGYALEAGDTRAALAVIDGALTDGLPPTVIHSRVITPAMHRIGQLWGSGELSVADEHLATAIVYPCLARLFPRLLEGQRESREELVVVAAVEGEQHEVGVRMVADVLEGAGFRVAFMGADVPARDLEAWIAHHRPAIVALGLSQPEGAPTLVAQLRRIHEIDPGIRLLIGGQGVPADLRATPGLTYVYSMELLAAAVTRALEQPTLLTLPPQPVHDRPGSASTGSLESNRDATSAEARLVEATASAADALREQGRRVFTLEQLAYRDPLTQLWNRRAFDDRYEELVMSGTERAPSLLMIDVDQFKDINDAYGHGAGDAALVAVAQCILSVLRPDDFAARFGGDEFAVLLPASQADATLHVAERIRAHVEAELHDPPVRVSIGVSSADEHDRREAMLQADGALLEAKRHGRNRVMVAL